MTMDSTALAAALKEYYPFDKVFEQSFLDKPLFALMRKDFNAGGENGRVTVKISNPQAVSSTFSSAQTVAASAASGYLKFTLSWKELYSLARISGKVIRESRNNELALVQALDSEIKGAIDSASWDINQCLFRDGSGSLGVLASESTVYATIANAAYGAGRLFKYKMELGAAASMSSAIRTGTATVTALNADTGVLTSDSNWTSQITSLTAGDHFFRVGDYVTASDRLKIYGFEGFCPATAPVAGDSFQGIDRSVDVTNLAGSRHDGSAQSIEEALLSGQSIGYSNGGPPPNYCFMSPYNVRQLKLALSSKVEYQKVLARNKDNKEIATIGFNALMIQGDAGDIAVVSDPVCPYDVAWMVNLDSFCLYSLGDFPGLLKEDGSEIQRLSNADAYEARIGGYAEVGCSSPCSIVRIKLA